MLDMRTINLFESAFLTKVNTDHYVFSVVIYHVKLQE